MLLETSAAAAALGAVAYGAGDFLGGCATRRIAAFGVVAIAQTVAMLFMFQHFTLEGASLPEGAESGVAVLAGVAYAVGLMTLYHGFANGRIAIVAPLCGLFGILVPLLGDIVLSRHIAPVQFLGIVICGFAVYLIAGVGATERGGGRRSWSIRLGIVSGMAYGVADLCLGMMPVEASTGALLVTRGVAAFLAASLVLVMVTRLATVPVPVRIDGGGLAPAVPPEAATTPFSAFVAPGVIASVLLATAAGAVDMAGQVGYVHAATRGSMGVAAALVALFPAVTVALAVIVLKERVSRVQCLGFAIAMSGVVLLVE